MRRPPSSPARPTAVPAPIRRRVLHPQWTINFDQFRGFETLSQRGAGTVAIRGTTDMATPDRRAPTSASRRARASTPRARPRWAGSDAAETLTTTGTVGGSVDMGGGGRDTVTLANGGLVEGDIQMGARR